MSVSWKWFRIETLIVFVVADNRKMAEKLLKQCEESKGEERQKLMYEAKKLHLTKALWSAWLGKTQEAESILKSFSGTTEKVDSSWSTKEEVCYQQYSCYKYTITSR